MIDESQPRKIKTYPCVVINVWAGVLEFVWCDEDVARAELVWIGLFNIEDGRVYVGSLSHDINFSQRAHIGAN